MSEQADENLFISSLTVAEILRGVLEKPAGRKRKQLERWFAGPEGPQALFAGRILPFDERAGLIWARLMAGGAQSGQPRSPLDMVIAAIAEANGCVVVTDNEKHFAGLRIVNPLRANRKRQERSQAIETSARKPQTPAVRVDSRLLRSQVVGNFPKT